MQFRGLKLILSLSFGSPEIYSSWARIAASPGSEEMSVQTIQLQTRCLNSPKKFKIDNLILSRGDSSVSNTENNEPTAMEIATYSIY